MTHSIFLNIFNDPHFSAFLNFIIYFCLQILRTLIRIVSNLSTVCYMYIQYNLVSMNTRGPYTV